MHRPQSGFIFRLPLKWSNSCLLLALDWKIEIGGCIPRHIHNSVKHLKWYFFAKIVKVHLKCLTGFWVCLWCRKCECLISKIKSRQKALIRIKRGGSTAQKIVIQKICFTVLNCYFSTWQFSLFFFNKHQ